MKLLSADFKVFVRKSDFFIRWNSEFTFLLDGVLRWIETCSSCRFFISVPSLQYVTKSYDLLTCALARAGQISLSILLQIWPRESVRPMVFGSAKTVWKLPTHLGPILRAVLRQMSLKLLTDITGKTVQVKKKTSLTFSWLIINFIQFFRLFLHSGISYSYFRNGWIQCILCIHTRITLYFICI